MKYDMILKKLKWDRSTVLYSSVSSLFCKYLALKLTLVCNQVLIDVGAYGPLS